MTDFLGIDRLSEAEGDVLLQLAEKAGALDGPSGYGVCARYDMERQCRRYNGGCLTRIGGLERLTPEERAIMHDLPTKGLTCWPSG